MRELSLMREFGQQNDALSTFVNITQFSSDWRLHTSENPLSQNTRNLALIRQNLKACFCVGKIVCPNMKVFKFLITVALIIRDFTIGMLLVSKGLNFQGRG